MKANRKFIIAGAGASGLLAVFLIATSGSPPEPPSMDAPTPVAAPAPQIEMEGVLVAQNEIPLGTMLSEKDLVWVQWPRQFAGPGSIRMSEDPNAIQTLKGGIARQAFFHGEPIRREKIVKTGTSGFLSALLPAGSRAMAINIDASGSMSAGGFILPNDRVDILRVISSAEGGETETILTNIRVLAIGQNIEEKNGERVVTGSNATLELTPSQAEIVTRSPELAEELAITTAELSYLPQRRTALENLSTRTGLDSVRQLCTVLIQSERYGTPLGSALRVISQESRDTRMMEAEKKAAGLPPKLTVPMIIFFLPVLFAVIITPAAIQVSRIKG